MNRIVIRFFSSIILLLALWLFPSIAKAELPDTFIDVPLTGNIQISLSNGNLDTVPISGIFRVVSHATSVSSEIEYGLIGTLANVSGRGEYTGLLYEATNSWIGVITAPQVKGNPLEIFGRTYLLTTVSTMMFPPEACPSGGACIIPLNLVFTVSFDPTGLMNSITVNSVTIPSGEQQM